MAWVDLAQAAFTLGVSERTIRNWIKNGKLRARSTDGHREVEIPDSEMEEGATAFTDDEDDDNPIDTQKRLEVALIECGRVKGTLASQERIMENLSANIAELQAKIQQSQNRIWQRTVVAVVVALLGVGAYLLASASHTTDLLQAENQFDKDLSTRTESVRESYEAKLTEREKSLSALRDQLDRERREAEDRRREELTQLEAKLKQEYDEDLAEQKKDLRELLQALQAQLASAREELGTLQREKIEAVSLLDLQKQDLARAQQDLETAERDNDVLKRQIEELEKRRRELEETERQLRRRLMGEE